MCNCECGYQQQGGIRHSIAAIILPLDHFVSAQYRLLLTQFFRVSFSFQWGESSYSLLLSPTIVSCLVILVFTGHEWTLSLSKRDEQETDVQKREVIQGEKSDIMLLQRLAIMRCSLYSCTRQIPGSLLNRGTKP